MIKYSMLVHKPTERILGILLSDELSGKHEFIYKNIYDEIINDFLRGIEEEVSFIKDFKIEKFIKYYINDFYFTDVKISLNEEK